MVQSVGAVPVAYPFDMVLSVAHIHYLLDGRGQYLPEAVIGRHLIDAIASLRDGADKQVFFHPGGFGGLEAVGHDNPVKHGAAFSADDINLRPALIRGRYHRQL